MGAVMVVVVTPRRDQTAGMAQVSEQVLVEALVPETAIEALHKAVSRIGFAGAMSCHSTRRSSCHLRMAFEVSSVPLSLTTMQGWPLTSAI